MKLRLSPVAVDDLLQLKNFISNEQQSPDAGLKVVRCIIDCYSKLVEFPSLGSSLIALIGVKTDFRYLICGTNIVFYKVDKEFILIYRILSTRQDYIKILLK